MLNVKKGEKVILKGFTGIKLGVFEVVSATKKTVTLNKKNGDEMVFDRNTGKQINVEEGKEKYANSIIEDDGSFVAPSTAGAKRKKVSKPSKKSTKVEEPEEDADEEDTEDEEEAPKKPVKKSKGTKKSKKQPEPDPEEDDEDDEDDDEYEEVDD